MRGSEKNCRWPQQRESGRGQSDLSSSAQIDRQAGRQEEELAPLIREIHEGVAARREAGERVLRGRELVPACAESS